MSEFMQAVHAAMAELQSQLSDVDARIAARLADANLVIADRDRTIELLETGLTLSNQERDDARRALDEHMATHVPAVEPPKAGVSIYHYDHPQTIEKELAMHVRLAGGTPDVWRAFGSYGGGNWVYPNVPNCRTKVNLATKDIWLSLKFTRAEMQAVARGEHDAKLEAIMRSFPTNVTTGITGYHEPEDNIRNGEFTWTEYALLIDRIATVAKRTGLANIITGPIFMGRYQIYELDGGFLPAVAKVPGLLERLRANLDFIGWDPYEAATREGTYGQPQHTPEYFYGPCRDWTAKHFPGQRMSIGETGYRLATSGEYAKPGHRVAFLKAAWQWCVDNKVLWVCYFDAYFWELGRLQDAAGTEDPLSPAEWGSHYT